MQTDSLLLEQVLRHGLRNILEDQPSVAEAFAVEPVVEAGTPTKVKMLYGPSFA